jgi:hypothetical protein
MAKKTIKIKGCRRCEGDMFWDTDDFRCMQCGRTSSPPLVASSAPSQDEYSPPGKTGRLPRLPKGQFVTV